MSEASNSWTKFSSFLLEAVFPTRCTLCEVGDSALCQPCLSEMERNPAIFESEGPLDYSRRIFAYNGRASQAVQSLKYLRATALADPMARILADEAERHALLDDAVAIPVPIHWTRQFERGFNQAELLCRYLRCPLETEWLIRTRATRPQASLRATERRMSMDGVFQAAKAVRGRRIVLVDDVVTTGETARACAMALKAEGALEVGVLSFAGNP